MSSEREGVATYDDLPVKSEEFVEVEEVKEEKVVEKPVKEVEKVEKPVELTLAEKKEDEARRHGWRPLEEWKGDPLEWRNSEVFLERGKYFNIMKDQKVKIDSLETKIDGMAKYQKDLRLVERQKVLKELAEQKVEALENEEFVKVVAIDDKINEERSAAMNEAVVEELPTSQQPVQSPEDQAAWNRFVGDNGWYTSDSKKRMYADAIGIDYKTNNPYAPVSEILTYVQEEVQLRFDTVVSTVAPASPVDTSNSRSSHSTRAGGKKKMTVNDLSPMELDMGQTFVDQGAFDSIDEYIASLEEIGGRE